MTPGLLIAGAGLAAQRCCETLRALGQDGPITIVGPERPYDRPPLSKDPPAKPPWLRPLVWYAQHDVTLRTGVAARLHAGRQLVELADGERLRYDDLLIATGSEPVRRRRSPGSRTCRRCGRSRTRRACGRPWTRARR
jgi:3-phenylpropionate/trans-cinnamate dioxygenase ferredoxin reductase component